MKIKFKIKATSRILLAENGHICEAFAYATMKQSHMCKLSFLHMHPFYSDNYRHFNFKYMDFFAYASSFRPHYAEYSNMRPQLKGRVIYGRKSRIFFAYVNFFGRDRPNFAIYVFLQMRGNSNGMVKQKIHHSLFAK